MVTVMLRFHSVYLHIGKSEWTRSARSHSLFFFGLHLKFFDLSVLCLRFILLPFAHNRDFWIWSFYVDFYMSYCENDWHTLGHIVRLSAKFFSTITDIQNVIVCMRFVVSVINHTNFNWCPMIFANSKFYPPYIALWPIVYFPRWIFNRSMAVRSNRYSLSFDNVAAF